MGGGPARQRRHTLAFLQLARQQSPILLDTDVDMTHVVAHRSAARETGDASSHVSYVVSAAARALVAHPEANAALRGSFLPRHTRYDHVTAKVAFDKRIDGVRAVVCGLVPDADRLGLEDVDARIRYFRDHEVEEIPDLSGIRTLHRLPWLLGMTVFRLANRNLRRRGRLLGTFSVSSLGHRPVQSFYPLGGTAVSFGVGQVRPTPVVRDGDIVVAPVARLSLVFDHRIIDGALAADLLHDVKANLESGWACHAGAAAAGERPAAAASPALAARRNA